VPSAKKQKLKQSTLSFSSSIPFDDPSPSPRLSCNSCHKTFANIQGLGSHRQFCQGPAPLPAPILKPLSNRKGAKVRKQWPLKLKWKTILTIERVEEGRLHLSEDESTRRRKTLEIVSKSLNIPLTNLYRWTAQKEKFVVKVQAKSWRNEKGARLLPAVDRVRHPEIELLLIQEFDSRRAEGKKVTGIWLQTTMRNLLQKHALLAVAESQSITGNGWLRNFKHRNNLVSRRKTNSKPGTLQQILPKLRTWHASLVKRSAIDAIDPLFGRWSLVNRWNVDQVPFCVTDGRNTTLERSGAYVVAVQGRKGEHKSSRDATIQLCINLSGRPSLQPRPVVMFRGKGLRISQAERLAYHPRVVVCFSPKAYYNDQECFLWVVNHFAPIVEAHNEKLKQANARHVLFVDNLSGQVNDAFLEQLSLVSCERHCFPPQQTDKLQPVDRNVGQHLKTLVYARRDLWLEVPENAHRWFGDVGFDSLTASELRVLISRWVGEAWERFLAELEADENLIYKAAQRTGCLLGPSGFLKEFQTGIAIPGIQDYGFSEADLPAELGVVDAPIVDDLEEARLVVEPDLELSPLVDEPREEPLAEPDEADLPVAPLLTDLLVPAGYNLDPEIPEEPTELIQRLVYLKASGRRLQDWYLARVSRLARPADNYIGRVMALTHEVCYVHNRPRGASASGKELVCLGRRQHGQTWYLLRENSQ